MDQAQVKKTETPTALPTLPSKGECFQYWDEYHTPSHIREHMKMVARVGKYLATRLKSAGEDVIVDLVDRACLLHDTVRVTDWDTLSFEQFPYEPTQDEITAWEEQRGRFPSTTPHADVNFQIFQGRYPEMAELIRTHSISDAPKVRGWEALLVNYADRRVAHDRIVTVEERLEEGHQRYSRTSKIPLERDPDIVIAIQRMEQVIYDRLDEDPEQLYDNIRNTKEEETETS